MRKIIFFFIMGLMLSCKKDNAVNYGGIYDTSTFNRLLAGMNFYYGNLHGHTKHSDGIMTVDETYIRARDSVGMNFCAVTDHAEQISDSEWTRAGIIADSLNYDGSFVALRGFEWSSSTYGHICVFNTKVFTDANKTSTLDAMYHWIDSTGAMAQLNHPGRTGNIYNNLAFASGMDSKMFSIETANKGESNFSDVYLPYYSIALDKGWHVAPAGNQDIHTNQFTPYRTVIIAPSLSRKALYDAFAAGNMYSCDDPDMKVIFKFGYSWMGSKIGFTGRAVFDVLVADNEPVSRLDLIANGKVYASIDAKDQKEIIWRPSVNVSEKAYYFVRVTGKNVNEPGDSIQVAVTAPIWFNQ